MLQSQHFFVSFGFSGASADASVALVLFSYMYSALSSALLAVSNWISRSFEYACDEFAVCARPALPLEHALIKLHVHNPSTMMPDYLYSAYHYSHPSLMERLEHLQVHNNKPPHMRLHPLRIFHFSNEVVIFSGGACEIRRAFCADTC